MSLTNLILFYRRFKTTDVPSSVSKGAPDFCTVYVISKGKISSVRSATSAAAKASPRNQVQHQASNMSDTSETPMRNQHSRGTYVSVILASSYIQPVAYLPRLTRLSLSMILQQIDHNLLLVFCQMKWTSGKR